jgi:hypothetical protein
MRDAVNYDNFEYSVSIILFVFHILSILFFFELIKTNKVNADFW